MPSDLTRPFEGGISVSSLIRRLTNAARSRRRHKRKEDKNQETESPNEKYYEAGNADKAGSVEKIATIAVDSIEAPPSGRENSIQTNGYDQTPIKANETPSAHDIAMEEKRGTAEIQDRDDDGDDELNSSIAKPAHDAHKNTAENMNDAPEVPDIHTESTLPHDPSIRSPSSIQRDTAGNYRSDEESSSDSTSASSILSSGYIPPPVTRSPDGSRIWTVRDWQAGRRLSGCGLNHFSTIDTRKLNSNAPESESKNEELAVVNNNNNNPTKDPANDVNVKFDLQLSLDPMLRTALMLNGNELVHSSGLEYEQRRIEPNYSMARVTRENNSWENNSLWKHIKRHNLIGFASVASLTIGFTLGICVRRYW